jgi:hypothetical protein
MAGVLLIYIVDCSPCAAAPSLGNVPPGEDPFFSTPAALLFAAQLVELIADVLDQPLPYPVARRDAIR